MKKEIWKPISGYKGLYEVSDRGRVRSLDRTVKNGCGYGYRSLKGRILKVTTDGSGYKTISLYKGSTKKTCKVHRALGEAFIPNPDNLPQINHKNGIKVDNRIENLEWTCASGNALHAYKMGLIPRPIGEKHGQAKFKDHQVLQIKTILKEGSLTRKQLSKIYGVRRAVIDRIATGKTWKHIIAE